jgi:hypothetical protein
MHGEPKIERYEFHCELCRYEWQMSYEVREPGASHPESRQYAYLTGLPASPPSAGRRCPNCWEPTYSSQLLDEPILARSLQ